MRLIKICDERGCGVCAFCNRNFDEYGGRYVLIEYSIAEGYTGETDSVIEPFEVCNKHLQELEDNEGIEQ